MKNFNLIKKSTIFSWQSQTILIAIISLVVAIVYGLEIKKYLFLKEEYQSIQTVINENNSQINRKQDLLKEKNNIKRRLKAVEAKKIFPDTYILKISEIIPDEVILKNFNYTKKKNIIIKGSSICLNGLTLFINKLSNVDLFKSIFIQKITNTDSISSFEILIELSA